MKILRNRSPDFGKQAIWDITLLSLPFGDGKVYISNTWFLST
jgi:hypothetical protein